MEKILIDEQELNEKFVERVEAMNEKLYKNLCTIHQRYGINRNAYVGGIMTVICSKSMSFETNLNNLLAIFQNNFNESAFFQCRYIKLTETLRKVEAFLREMGLDKDFRKFKDEKEAVIGPLQIEK